MYLDVEPNYVFYKVQKKARTGIKAPLLLPSLSNYYAWISPNLSV